MSTVRRFLAARRQASASESAGTLIIGIVLIGVCFTAFAIGFDIMRLAYLRASLANELDQAIVAAASRGTEYNGDDRLVIDRDVAQVVYEQVYAQNRAKYGGLVCPDPAPTIPGSGGMVKCWDDGDGAADGIQVDDEPISPSGPARRGITVEVREEVRNLWGPFWHQGTSTIVVRSRAVIGSQGVVLQ